ncbi:MAG TPA: hypothetical protein VML94_06365 [Thermoplasmata archaeon]|nr:hypothetical protein [Thermoplasmata archaeon]
MAAELAGAPADRSAWGSCRFCGVAVPPGAAHCEICGADHPVPAGTRAPRAVRHRIRWTAALRTFLVVGVVLGLAYTIIDAEWTGPPNVADPLTTAGVHVIPVGTEYVLAGDISGGDYVIGNFTTIDPSGLSLAIVVYNASQWEDVNEGKPAISAWSAPDSPAGRIVFAAPYTDLYYFVFGNPYAPSSNLTVTAYITTEYESNVGDEGTG